MWRSKLIILLLCLKEAALQNSCNKHKSCAECILDQNDCSWCTLNEINESRCMPRNTATNRCPSNMIQAPNGNAVAVEHKHEDTAAQESRIWPQKYDIKIRPGQPVKFDFIYKFTKNNPVDVYFLIDASHSMKSIKKQTADQSENIYKALNKMTTDVKLGFGTFIDKNALPYTKTIDSKETYSFKHNLSLTKNYGKFKENLLSLTMGSNYDTPEGGLDAVCQAITCKDIIGWRNKSAKIIVYLSNGPFHAAGDGRMAGIFTPYDGKCYTVDNVYTKELEMDYPTVGMVNKLAIENEIKILFAVDNFYSNEYTVLSDAISRSILIYVNSSSADPVLMNTLSAIYNNITSEVNLIVNMKTGRRNFKITFNPDCTKDLNKNNIDKACKLKPNINGEFKITGTITLLEYQEIDNYGIDITVEGFSDKLYLDVKVIKTCDCESKKEYSSKYCNGEIFECGICKCSNNKYGEKCSCLAGSNAVTNNSTCIYAVNGEECSGHGHCDCGLCNCNLGYDGSFCECVKNSCEMSNDLPCGGEGRGKCECGTCKCDGAYIGKACQCDRFDVACISPNNEQICSGLGDCECGKCKCNIPKWEKRANYDAYCTMLPCPICHSQQCLYIEDCVLCTLKNATNVTCPCEGLDVKEVTMKDMENKTDWSTCSDLRVAVGCYTKFLYKYNDDVHRILVLMTKEMNCAESYYITCGAVLGSILLIGILTLIIWKVITELSYRREYTKFVDAHKDDLAGTCENPLYESPTTYFRNPAFRKKSIN